MKPKIPARKWRNAIDAAQRECKTADVPYVIIAISPDTKQAHGGYNGPASAIAGILAATNDSMNRDVQNQSMIVDTEGNPVFAGQGGSTKDEGKADVHGGGSIRRTVRRWFRR